MLKVLIVDDELPIREWLEFCVNHSSVTCSVVGMASNGKAALELFEKKNPDLIITDIKMPVMGGLDLITEIRKQNKEIPLIILTSYSDFDFARSALQYGVSEYILKTEVTIALMDEILFKISKEIECRYQGSQKYKIIQEKNRLLEESLEGMKKWDDHTISDMLAQLNAEISEYGIFAVSLVSAGTEVIFDQIKNLIEKAMILSYGKNQLFLVGNLKECSVLSKQKEVLYKIGNCFIDQTKESVGISNVYTGYKWIPIALREAENRRKQQFWSHKKGIYMEEIAGNENGIRIVTEMRQKFIKISKTDNFQESQELLFEIMGYIKKVRLFNIAYVRETCEALLKYLYYAYGTYSEKEMAEMERISGMIKKADYFSEIEEYMKEYVQKIQKLRTENITNYSAPIQRAVMYIKENYAKSITLSDVAEYLEFSPDYFSRIFKEETGINFTAYLTEVRLRQAAELLSKTNMKVYEVSDLVGYSNMSYFSTVFKKKYGLNPFDFKTQSVQSQKDIFVKREN